MPLAMKWNIPIGIIYTNNKEKHFKRFAQLKFRTQRLVMHDDQMSFFSIERRVNLMLSTANSNIVQYAQCTTKPQNRSI